ncbi:hypothetical protein OESDEN_11083 [Oesophagostomum dentatum]|uniref:Endonuclease/exonuclease/phosphatase domain-containing protein n=1 Tax=Oesophagostomum dentatum TaxID=61180 RepID=A0A0B1T110_OESDE|nr:hypothetical protein OESDEN_11083 [Oesophagostomum dentatum]
MKKENRRQSPNGTTHAEIDHILTNRKWCLLDVPVVSSFSCRSDHRLLRAKILEHATGNVSISFVSELVKNTIIVTQATLSK